jgi:hypothetical protein
VNEHTTSVAAAEPKPLNNRWPCSLRGCRREIRVSRVRRARRGDQRWPTTTSRTSCGRAAWSRCFSGGRPCTLSYALRPTPPCCPTSHRSPFRARRGRRCSTSPGCRRLGALTPAGPWQEQPVADSTPQPVMASIPPPCSPPAALSGCRPRVKRPPGGCVPPGRSPRPAGGLRDRARRGPRARPCWSMAPWPTGRSGRPPRRGS